MEILEIILWAMVAILFYTYIGYAVILYLAVRIRRLLRPRADQAAGDPFAPVVTLFITAYNEEEYVDAKMANSLALDYPQDKLDILWVTDGSDDGTVQKLAHYKDAHVLHEPGRKGKIAAMNRGMKAVTSPIVVFSDANTMLGRESIRRIVALFRDRQVGCVSGEKRIINREADTAPGAGEGLYWKYESALKKWDAELHSVVGAAGELFAIRTELFKEVEADTLLDDFIISLRVAQAGYTIQYDPQAYAIESASASVKEEWKRKVRISAGGFQSIVRLRSLLNVFKYGTLTFQYISHRVLRWTLAPLCLVLLIPVFSSVAIQEGLFSFHLYSSLFWLQCLFYLAALAGWMLENKSLRIKIFFIPYYFLMMNLSVIMGFSRYLRGGQSVNWERAKRGI